MVDIKLELPKGFLEEEERCGFLVTKQMKEVWAIELDMFVEFDRVCKKHGITYFASGGTMIGVVRHKGFIPWDDDIDVMMMRDHYEKLCKIAPLEFKYPYFFQTQYTDFGSLRGQAQLRNCQTTAILKEELKYKYQFNQGIFLDIFPLDVVTENQELYDLQAADAAKYKGRASNWASWSNERLNKYSLVYQGPKYAIKRIAGKIFRWPIKQMVNYNYRKFEEVCKRYNNSESTLIGGLSVFNFNRRDIKFREDYQEVQWMDFEFLKMPVPVRYDHALRTRFGDYMQIVKGNSLHSGLFFDTDKPYTEYIR